LRKALDRLTSRQRNTQKIITLHHAYIAGENDSEGDVHAELLSLLGKAWVVDENVIGDAFWVFQAKVEFLGRKVDGPKRCDRLVGW